MNTVSRIPCIVLSLGLVATPLRGQLGNDPVRVSPKDVPGLTIAGDVGQGMNIASDRNTSFNGMATLGLPSLQVTVGVGLVHLRAQNLDIVNANQAGARLATPQEPATTSANFMARAALTLVPSTRAVPLDVVVFGGVGLASGTGVTTAPLGLAIGVEIPSPGISMEPWVAPRFSYYPGSGGPSSTFFGISGGLNVDLSTGLGFQAAVDYLKIPGASPMLASVGVHYRFSVLGVGAVGG